MLSNVVVAESHWMAESPPLPSRINEGVYCLGDDLAMEPDDWLDQLLASGALVEVPSGRLVDREAIDRLGGLINEQAEDEGLWAVMASAPEAYLQQELRRLHAAVAAALGDTDD